MILKLQLMPMRTSISNKLKMDNSVRVELMILVMLGTHLDIPMILPSGRVQ